MNLRTIFECDTRGTISVIEPGRAKARVNDSFMVPGLFTRHIVIVGFDGENHITVFQTGRQDGRNHVLITHSKVDDETEIVFNELLKYDDVAWKIAETLNGMWGSVPSMRIKLLNKMPIVGNAHDDAGVFNLAHMILTDPEATQGEKFAALRKMDEATGEPGEYTQAAINEYLSAVG